MLIKRSSGFTYRAGPPASIDFSASPDVTAATLLGIVDTTRGVEVYVADDDTLGGQWQGRVLVLFGAPPSVANADQLLVFLNDGRTAAGDDTLQSFEQQAHADALAALEVADTLSTENTLKGVADDINNFSARNHTDIGAASDRNHTDVTAFSDRNHADIGKLDTDLNSAAGQAHEDSGRLDTDLNTFAGSNHADLGRIEALLAAQRQETLWTDDSRGYFVRLDTRGTITWTDLSGAPGPAPGVGARPAAGDDALLDKSSYQAINAGTGYAVNDLIDHVVTTDPKTGVIVGHFWLNITAETTIAAPSAADIEPLSRLPDDAARASLQSSIGVTAHADAQKLDTDVVAAATQAHTDSGQLDTDLKAGFSTNHTDLTTISGKVATAARQDTGNTSLATIATGIGAPADADPGSDTAAGSISARLARLLITATGLGTLLGAIRDRLPSALVGGRLSVDGSGVVQPVSGSAAVGAAPTQPPLSVSGVDGGGLKRHILTDAAGRLLPGANAPRVSNTVVLAAQGATVTLAVDGMATGVAQITGTWAGSVSWAGSIDGGATYFPMNVTPFGAGGGTSVGSATANGQWEFSVAGLTHVQATMTAFTSGSASVLLAASSGGKIARVKAPAGDPLPVQSPSGGVAQTIVTGTSGTLIAANPSRKSLRWMVIGASDATVSPGTAPPTTGQGMVYQAGGAGKQGASEAFMEGAMATNAFAYAASAATSIVVWECQ